MNILLQPLYAEDPDMRCPVGGGPGNVGFPVNVTTGNVWLDQTDAVLPGTGPEIAFRRSYNSLNGFKTRGGVFGPGWHHSFERSITVAPGATLGLILRGSDGVPLYFQDNDDQDLTYKPFAPVTEESWIVRRPATNDYVRYFRAGGSEEYDSIGRLSAMVDPSGNRTTLTWQGSQLTSIADQGGRALTLGYEGGLLTTLSGPAGLIATYEFDNGTLSRVTYADESGYQIGYLTEAGGQRLLESVRDLSSPATTLEFHEYVPGTGKGRTSERGGGQEKLTLDYNYAAKTKVTDALGNVTWYEYWEFAGLKRVVKIEGPCLGCGATGQQVQQWAYDTKGRVTSYTDGADHKWTYTYDPATGDLWTETTPAPESAQTVYTYWPDGRVHTITRPDTGVTTYTYGPAGPLTITESVTSTQNRTTTLTYYPQGDPQGNPPGKLWTIQDPRGKTTTLRYNTFGDLTTVTNPLQKVTTFGYDALGRRTSVTDALQHTTSTPYGDGVHITSIIKHDLTHTDFTYDKGGRRKTVKDPLGHVTEYGYDLYGRLHTVTTKASATDPPNTMTTYDYDLMSNLKFITDARAKVTTFDYDGFNRVKKVTYPPGPTLGGPFESFTYYPSGNLWTKTDRNGAVTTYSYDNSNRLSGKTYSDLSTEPVSFTYDPNGRLKTAVSATDSLTWTYDLAGQLRSEVSTANSSTVAYDYDLAGNRWTLTLNGTLYLTYGYDDASWLRTITRNTSVFTFDYYDDGCRMTLTYPNGIVTTYTYDTLSQLKTLTAKLGAATVTSAGYNYDDGGNRSTKTMLDYAETYTPALPPDPIYRLGDVQRGGTTTEHYTYDTVGNRLSSLTNPLWTYDDRNELQSNGTATFGYDLNGNLTSKAESGDSWTYEWNAENQLMVVRKNGIDQAWFSYDPLGRRATKAWGPQSRRYLYDGNELVRETDYNRQYIVAQSRYINGSGTDEPLAKDDGSSLSYLHADGLGSIVATTNTSGAVTTTRRYDAWGNLEQGSTTPGYAFTGREWDPETGLYYYRARYYDPKIGRFISEDPLGFDDGANFYTYVANNPVKFLDPLGLMKIVICQRQHTLTLFDDKGKSLMNAPVKCGCTKTPTPSGDFKAGQWQSEPTDPRFSGPNGWSKDPWGNPYGPYYLPIGPTGCGIHGTRGSAWLGNLFINVPDFDIENLCSHGCVRLSNPNITQLHELIPKPKGTSIVIKDSCE